MKKLLAAAAVACLASVASTAFAADATANLKVSGWHCSGCAQDTVAALKKVKGVKNVNADFEKSEVVVAYDDAQAKPADFEKAVKKTGYEIAK